VVSGAFVVRVPIFAEGPENVSEPLRWSQESDGSVIRM
jgi:hypothetical protein